MKILHIIPGLTRERGGPSVVIEALVRHQTEAGHRVAVLTTDQGARNGEKPVALHPAAELIQVPVRGPDRLAYAPAFRGLLRQHLRSCDVTHVHSIFTYPVHVALREAADCKAPVLLRPCGLLHPYSLRQSHWRKRAYLTLWGPMVRRACTAWHYTSEQERAESWPHDAGRNFVLPNGIDPEEFAIDRAEARETVGRIWPRLEQSPYVLFLGRIHPKKRLDLLLAAFLRGAPAKFKLVVAGPDECGLWDQLEARLFRDKARADRLVKIGTVAGPDKAALLAGACLFALPSEHENFGIAALEALATGTPVLLSPHVDLAECAVQAGLGISVPLEVEAWSEQLDNLLSRRETGESVPRAREWVREHYAWRGIAAKLTRHYQKIITQPASACQLACAAAEVERN